MLPFSPGEKDRVRGLENQGLNFSNPLTPTLSLRERGLRETAVCRREYFLINSKFCLRKL
jgi:hypothetical protein